jgi:hypothetical protein
MDINRQHPLGQIAGYNSLSMLEALIPYVDYSLKLPLALFIKFNEMKLIIRTFQNKEALQQSGLHNPNSSPYDLLGALTGISPEMLQMLVNLSQNGSFPFPPESNFNEKGPPPDSSMPDFSVLSDLLHNNENAPDSFGSQFGNFDSQINNTSSQFSNFDTQSDNFDAQIDNIFAQYDYDVEHSMIDNCETPFNKT